jgi:hypothetical protein
MKQMLGLVAATLVLSTSSNWTNPVRDEHRIGHDLLVEDVRQLTEILETAHPDPYFRGGGRIAYHRRLQHLLRSIPTAGMTRREFALLAAPLVASIGDGHTALSIPYSHLDAVDGVPLEFDVVERLLYVTGVSDERDRELLGAILVSVEGVPVSSLMDRLASLSGVDNEYAALIELAKSGYLERGDQLASLIPEWRQPKSVHVELRSPSGEKTQRDFVLPLPGNSSFIRPTRSSVSIPSIAKADFTYGFMDDSRRIAFLRVVGMTTYREAYELNGTDYARDTIRDTYRRSNGSEPPTAFDELLAGIPSAAETFKSLVIDMKAAGTKALIVDVRNNQGGVSLMNDMLIWFLFGRDEYYRVKSLTATDVVKLSDKYFAERPGTTLESINQGQPFALLSHDYDLRYDCTDDPEKLAALDLPGIMESAVLRRMPSFYKEYESGEYAGYYHPAKVVVLCNGETFSGGYSLMWWLYQFGAEIVGTPSAQAGNAFLDILTFQLRNSGLRGQVSTKYQQHFPDDPKKGRVLRPHHELTYEYLASTGFDPNASVLLAMEKLGAVSTVR